MKWGKPYTTRPCLYVEIHLSLIKVQALIRICGTIIEFDAQSLLFGGELRFHDLVSKGMSFGILIIIGRVGLLSSSGSLMNLCLSRRLLLVMSVIFQSRFVPTCPRVLTKVNTWWDPSRAQRDEKGDAQASGIDQPRALTGLGH